MYQTFPLMVISGDNLCAINRVMQTLTAAGLHVIRSFDLQVARAAQTDCPCPHHGTAMCDCQMVVLLVYDQDRQRVTLVAHGHDRHTQLAFVDSPNDKPDARLLTMIRETLLSQLHPDDRRPNDVYALRPAAITERHGCAC